jgi:hypothetical protein
VVTGHTEEKLHNIQLFSGGRDKFDCFREAIQSDFVNYDTDKKLNEIILHFSQLLMLGNKGECHTTNVKVVANNYGPVWMYPSFLKFSF